MESLGAIVFVIWFVAQLISDEKKKKQRQRQNRPLPPDLPLPQRMPPEGIGRGEDRSQSPLDFEIPPIAGAPGSSDRPSGEYEDVPPEWGYGEEAWEYDGEEPSYDAREVIREGAAEASAAKAARTDVGQGEPRTAEKRQALSGLPLLRNPATAREAVLYAEVFGRPKALRRR